MKAHQHPRPRTALLTSNRSLGLSLLELMIALGILSLMGTLALPALKQHWLRAHRTEGLIALSELQSAQERFRSRTARYATTLAELQQPGISPGGRYQLALSDVGNTGYRLEARPIGTQRDDQVCHRLRLRVESGDTQRTAADDQQRDTTSTCWPQ